MAEQYNKAEIAIKNVGTATSESMDIAKANAKQAIQEYKNLAIALQRAETAATNLRPKDIPTIQSIEIQNLKKFEAQINNSKVPVKEMKKEIDELNKALSQPMTSREDVIQYLNQLDIAKAKFKALEEQYKNTETLKYYNRIKSAIQEVTKLTIARNKVTSSDETKELDRQLEKAKQRIRNNEKILKQKGLYNNELQRQINNEKRLSKNKINLSLENQRNKKNAQATKEQEQALKNYNRTIPVTPFCVISSKLRGFVLS